MSTPLLDVRNLSCHFPAGRESWWRPGRPVRAVDGVSFQIMPGESLGLVGESGCGKSTLGNLVSALLPRTSGEVLFDGKRITPQSVAQDKKLRGALQVIFQDPAGTLNPRLTVLDQVAEPLRIQGIDLPESYREIAVKTLEQVGLKPEHGERFSHELSGGQRQRVVVARALVTKPRLVVCDEPTSALDVSIQAQVINLLAEMKMQHGMSYLFISHNLGVVRSICERVAVMYLGRIVEMGSRETLFSFPLHPYTQALLAANPIPDPSVSRKRALLTGDPPSPVTVYSGCRFHSRCIYALPHCAEHDPPLQEFTPGHYLACCNPQTQPRGGYV